ncbi:transcriptional regulator, LuxR family [Burkholderiales bacterium GJ-E10]|nr:transcriptional regulator, LuxR family [Burkholderiales bacterium GJ-E10]
MEFTDRLSRTLIEIYRASREMKPRDFEDFAMGLLRSFIPFDSSRWAMVELVGKGAITHSVHLINEPADIVLDWESVNRLDKMMHAVVGHPGRAHTIDTEEVFAERKFGEIRDYTRRYRHANTLGILVPTTAPPLQSAISLFRAKRENHFDQCELALLERLMPHLVEALAVNRAIHVERAGDPAAERSARAIASTNGVLHYAGRYFGVLLAEEWPGWNGAVLPEPLLASLSVPGASGYVGRAIRVCAERLGEQLFLQASRKCCLAQLSKREMDVARRYGLGKSYKDIAHDLGISPVTCRNYIQNIFKKLAIRDKSELGALLFRENGLI